MSLYIDVFIQINIHNYKINLNYFFYYDVFQLNFYLLKYKVR